MRPVARGGIRVYKGECYVVRMEEDREFESQPVQGPVRFQGGARTSRVDLPEVAEQRGNAPQTCKDVPPVFEAGLARLSS